ncbi:MAG: sigma-70 family RNA polymerase sigma factor [Clostridia bacterium]|nr:sigma-70 family RNA polymerase sigma factor [Clostridia bacterium]
MQTIEFFKKNKTARFDADLPEDTVDAYKAADGDTAAFERLVRKYEKYVCTTVYSVVRNYDDSFDVAQEVFLKLYHNIGSFKGESSFSSWLYRIAKNTALDFLRKEKKNKNNVSLYTENGDGEETELSVPDTSVSSNPEQTAVKNEAKDIIYTALDEISEEHKEIIILRDIDGYTYEEIAEMLGLEYGTVKSRLFRAREALRKKLLEKNYFDSGTF